MELMVRIPTLLRDSTGGQDEFLIAGATLDEALQRLRVEYPLHAKSVRPVDGLMTSRPTACSA